ncbi:EYxxD motif small membrane protein [Bacillus kexueae]
MFMEFFTDMSFVMAIIIGSIVALYYAFVRKKRRT